MRSAEFMLFRGYADHDRNGYYRRAREERADRNENRFKRGVIAVGSENARFLDNFSVLFVNDVNVIFFARNPCPHKSRGRDRRLAEFAVRDIVGRVRRKRFISFQNVDVSAVERRFFPLRLTAR